MTFVFLVIHFELYLHCESHHMVHNKDTQDNRTLALAYVHASRYLFNKLTGCMIRMVRCVCK